MASHMITQTEMTKIDIALSEIVKLKNLGSSGQKKQIFNSFGFDSIAEQLDEEDDFAQILE
jgi:hypothetical protein